MKRVKITFFFSFCRFCMLCVMRVWDIIKYQSTQFFACCSYFPYIIITNNLNTQKDTLLHYCAGRERENKKRIISNQHEGETRREEATISNIKFLFEFWPKLSEYFFIILINRFLAWSYWTDRHNFNFNGTCSSDDSLVCLIIIQSIPSTSTIAWNLKSFMSLLPSFVKSASKRIITIMKRAFIINSLLARQLPPGLPTQRAHLMEYEYKKFTLNKSYWAACTRLVLSLSPTSSLTYTHK